MPNCVRHLRILAQVNRDEFSRTARHGDLRHFYARNLFRLPARQRTAFSRKGQPPSTTSRLWRHTRSQQDAGVCLRSCCCTASLRTLRSKSECHHITLSKRCLDDVHRCKHDHVLILTVLTGIQCFFLSLSVFLSICFSSNFLMYN